MSISETVKDNLAYSKDLVGSGIEGARQARKAVMTAEDTTDLVTEAAQESWQAGTIGVMVGAILGALADVRGLVFHAKLLP
jgi:ADP-ribosylglycohydrolase